MEKVQDNCLGKHFITDEQFAQILKMNSFLPFESNIKIWRTLANINMFMFLLYPEQPDFFSKAPYLMYPEHISLCFFI